MRLSNHLNIVDVSDDMMGLHLKHLADGDSLFFGIRPFQPNGFILGVGGSSNQFLKVMAIGAQER